MKPPEIQVGNIEIVEQLVEEHSEFCENLPVLEKSINDFFKGPFHVTKAQDMIHQFCGTVCKYLFNASILLASNGYGAAALSILRTMAEYTINAAYIGKNPDAVEDFLDWVHVKNYRTLQDHLSLGEDWADEMFGTSKRVEVEANYERVKGRFKGKNDWCAKPLRQRAQDCGLTKLFIFLYRPFTSAVHADIVGLGQTGQREFLEDLGVVVDWNPSLRSVDRALRGAHLCVVIALSVFNEEMGLGRRTDVESLLDGYSRIWGSTHERMS